MKIITDEHINHALNLYNLTYGTKTVQEMVMNQNAYAEYVKKLALKFGEDEKDINDQVWDKFQQQRQHEEKQHRMVYHRYKTKLRTT